MDSITIGHLRESVALQPMGDLGPVDEFYRRLFELAPEVRPLFEREMGLQAKKFSDMLAWVITHLEHSDGPCRELRELGSRHGGYGVKIDQYAQVGSALIWMFQHTLGDRFTRFSGSGAHHNQCITLHWDRWVGNNSELENCCCRKSNLAE